MAILVQPVMPDSMAELLTQLGQPDGEARRYAAIADRLVPGTELPKPSGVFPRYEEPEVLKA